MLGKRLGIQCLGLVILSFTLFLQAGAQTSKADLEEMMKKAQETIKKYGTDTTTAQIIKKLQDQQKMVSGAMGNPSATNGRGNALSAGDYSNVDSWKFPPRDEKRISLLAQKVYTKTELTGYLNSLYAQIAKILDSKIRASVETLASKYGKDGGKMGDVAIEGWYTSYREESLLLMVGAAAKYTDNGLLLNNCAAILNMAGLEDRAIPVLKYLLQTYSPNAMVLNNLGQSYAGLGETDTAMYYFAGCIKMEPENPEANNTAGQIAVSKGNTAAAVAYFEHSVQGSFTKTAALKLRKIYPDEKFDRLIKPNVKIPEYFNQFKYHIPAQCTSVNNAATADAGQKAFSEMIGLQLKRYAAAESSLGSNMNRLLPASRILRKGEFMSQPYFELCGIMARDQNMAFHNEITELGNSTDKKYYSKMKGLQQEYDEAFQKLKKSLDDRVKPTCCGEGNTSCCVSDEVRCKAYNDLANLYLPQFAQLTEDWQSKNQLVFKKYFDVLIYWGYLSQHPLGDNFFRQNAFYPLVSQYLLMLSKINYTKIIKPCLFTPVTASADSNGLHAVDCPLDISIPFVVGKLELNCEKFSFSGGEGLLFGYENNFKTKQSTLTIGAGLQLELSAHAGAVKAGVSAEASEHFFISFDGDNKISDFGVKEHIGVTAEAPLVGQFEKSVGGLLGVYSGFTYEPGTFKSEGGEIQINKNVNFYKSN